MPLCLINEYISYTSNNNDTAITDSNTVLNDKPWKMIFNNKLIINKYIKMYLLLI